MRCLDWKEMDPRHKGKPKKRIRLVVDQVRCLSWIVFWHVPESQEKCNLPAG